MKRTFIFSFIFKQAHQNLEVSKHTYALLLALTSRLAYEEMPN